MSICQCSECCKKRKLIYSQKSTPCCGELERRKHAQQLMDSPSCPHVCTECLCCSHCPNSDCEYERGKARENFFKLRDQWSSVGVNGGLNKCSCSKNLPTDCGCSHANISPGQIRQIFGTAMISETPEYCCQPDPREWSINKPNDELTDIQQKCQDIIEWAENVKKYEEKCCSGSPFGNNTWDSDDYCTCEACIRNKKYETPVRDDNIQALNRTREFPNNKYNERLSMETNAQTVPTNGKKLQSISQQTSASAFYASSAINTPGLIDDTKFIIDSEPVPSQISNNPLITDTLLEVNEPLEVEDGIHMKISFREQLLEPNNENDNSESSTKKLPNTSIVEEDQVSKYSTTMEPTEEGLLNEKEKSNINENETTLKQSSKGNRISQDVNQNDVSYYTRMITNFEGYHPQFQKVNKVNNGSVANKEPAHDDTENTRTQQEKQSLEKEDANPILIVA